MQIQAVAALSDNYIWLIKADNGHTIVVDPGEATPVLSAIAAEKRQLNTVLITHRHHDHIGGLAELSQLKPELSIYGPQAEAIPLLTHPINRQTNHLNITHFPPIHILFTEGHTEGHISYLLEDHLFCGDTLFAGGCGRLLGGTAEQLFTSLQTIRGLPSQTYIHCAHEYTLANLQFALNVEPNNVALQARFESVQNLRQQGKVTLPSQLSEEIDTNPFLRCHIPAVQKAAAQYCGHSLDSELAVFTVLRAWKDRN